MQSIAMDHLPPPPPYSEHDTESYSTSHSAHPHPILTPNTTSTLNAASVSERPVSENDAASSIGDPIYTPPYTPESPNDSLHRASLGYDLDHLAFSASAIAAAAYFESRAVKSLSTDTLLIHNILITRDTQPADLPFPKPEENWLERDVLPEDWQTFVNYLIPHHIETSNSGVADRKLRAELIDERMNRLTLGQEHTSRTDFNAVDAQLGPLRQSHANQEICTYVDSIIRVWNEGFFGPRGLLVEVSVPDVDDVSRVMPGSWAEDPVEEPAGSINETSRSRFRRGFGSGWIKADNSGFHIGKNFLSADEKGFRMGKSGLVADSNGFRIGNVLVADGQGFKLGPIKADSYGFRIGGPDRPHHVQQENRGHHPEHRHVQMPHTDRGRRHDNHTQEPAGQRDRSRSTSSSSSSDSSASFQSVGSLPDYDHLDYGQLPVARKVMNEWLRHPEQVITKETVRKIRDELKSARGGKGNGSEEDRKALRQEVRQLFRDFKGLKKEQRQQWKAAKRERRAARKTAKRTRRSAKHQVRDTARQARKQCKREIKEGKRRDCHSSFPPIPAIPTIPVMNSSSGATPRGNTLTGDTNTGRSGWPFMGNFQPPDSAKTFEIQREGTRIEREAALENAAKSREEALASAALAREQAQITWGKALADASTARERAHVDAGINRRKAEANASIARRRAAASRISADAERMQADVDRMRIQADKYDGDAKPRLKMLDVAERLQEEAEKLRREGARLTAEVQQLEEDLKHEFQTEVVYEQGVYTTTQEDPLTAQESGMIHDQLNMWIKATNEKH